MSELTKNQALVLKTLAQAEVPLSAYTILDALRDDGFRAPLQVYRALDKLIQFGKVHRLESLNAFVACKHPECAHAGAVAFAICDACGTVAEISDAQIANELKRVSGRAGFNLKNATVELRGVCEACES